jgi:hypothetical protein
VIKNEVRFLIPGPLKKARANPARRRAASPDGIAYKSKSFLGVQRGGRRDRAAVFWHHAARQKRALFYMVLDRFLQRGPLTAPKVQISTKRPLGSC